MIPYSTPSSTKKGVQFQDSVTLLEAAARDDYHEGNSSLSLEKRCYDLQGSDLRLADLTFLSDNNLTGWNRKEGGFVIHFN